MSGQIWAVNSLGGYMHSENLSKKFRHALQPTCRFRQFADIKDATQQGKHKGSIFHWDVFSNVATQGTTLTETNTMPETNFTISQGTLTITEAGNSVPFSQKLDNLSVVPLTPIVTKTLRNDAMKAFDTLAHAQFTLTPLRASAYDGTSTSAITLATTGTQTSTSTVAFGKGHAKAMVDTMKERNIPAYAHGDYYGITWPSTIRTFKNDLEAIKMYTAEGFGMIKNGEVGRYENTRYVEQTNIAKSATTYTDWIYFVGEETVAEAIAVPEEIRGKIPGDYGRSKGVAWYYLGGFGLCHTSAMGTDEARIIKWESAA
jgi:N4-gp56 family major capsid protein